jgi:hypothetical protein
LSSLWDDLEGNSGHALHAAVWTLARSPGDSIPFLRERLRPVRAMPDAVRLARLVAELDHDSFAARERAMRELAQAGLAAAPYLHRALRETPSLELRRRTKELLTGLSDGGLGGNAMRALWAVEALEHAGTAEAQALLRELAGGAAGHPLTEEAKQSLRRLEKRAAGKR